MGSGKLLALVHSFRRTNYTAASHHEHEHEQTAAGSFEADLAERVQQLQLQGGGSAHLNWLLDACACTLSTHSSLASLLSSVDAPPPSQRADEVLSLLDVCTSLKQVASDVDRQLRLLQRALHSTEQALLSGSGANLRAAAHRLRACVHGLQAAMMGSSPTAEAHVASLLAAKRLQVAAPASCSVDGALDGTLLISLLVLASALSSFEAPAPSSRPSSRNAMRCACKLVDRYASTCSKSSSSSSSWVAPLRQLQRDLKQEEMSAVFRELQGLHASTSSLVAAITTSNVHIDMVRQSVNSLGKRSQEAQACMSTLRLNLASLFQALLSLRLALLRR